MDNDPISPAQRGEESIALGSWFLQLLPHVLANAVSDAHAAVRQAFEDADRAYEAADEDPKSRALAEARDQSMRHAHSLFAALDRHDREQLLNGWAPFACYLDEYADARRRGGDGPVACVATLRASLAADAAREMPDQLGPATDVYRDFVVEDRTDPVTLRILVGTPQADVLRLLRETIDRVERHCYAITHVKAA